MFDISGIRILYYLPVVFGEQDRLFLSPDAAMLAQSVFGGKSPVAEAMEEQWAREGPVRGKS